MNFLRNNELFRSMLLFAGIMCLLGLLPVPMLSFYSVMRYVALGAAIWGLIVAIEQKQQLTVFKLIAAGILANPFFNVIPTPEFAKLGPAVAGMVFIASSLRLNAQNIREKWDSE